MKKETKNPIKAIVLPVFSVKTIMLSMFLLTFSFYYVRANSQPKVVKQFRIDNLQRDQTANPTEDWLFATIEDTDDKGFISCGFSDGAHGAGSSTPQENKKPSVVKVSASLGFMWRYDMTLNDIIYGPGGTQWNPVFDGSSRAADIMQVGDYYYILAFVPLKKATSPFNDIGEQTVLIKFDKNGQMQTGFPKAFNTSGWTGTGSKTYTRFRGVGLAYDYTNNKMYICGDAESTQWAARIEMTNYTINYQTDFGRTEGALVSVCPVYPNGGIYGKKPYVTNEAPVQIAFCGRNYYGGSGNNNCDAIIIRTDLDLSNPVTKAMPAPNNSDYNNTDYPRGAGGASTCPSKTVSRSATDLASSIEQLKNGQLLVAIKYNIAMLTGVGQFNFFKTGELCSVNWQVVYREQLIDADAFLMIIDKNFTQSTTPVRHQHVAHLNGDDFEFVLTQDLSGDYILGIGTIADEYRLVNSASMDEYWIFKYNPNLGATGSSAGNMVWEQAYQGCSKSRVCAFDIIPTYRGGILAVGNNYLNGESHDWMLLGRDCETGPFAYNPRTDIVPNMADGQTFSVMQHLAGSRSTTLNTQVPGNVFAQVIIEPGYTWNISAPTGATPCRMQFLNNRNLYDSAHTSNLQHSIIVKAGASLVLSNNTILTTNNMCGNTVWGGIQLESNITPDVQDGGKLVMTDATIENAETGVSVNSGGYIECKNTISTSNPSQRPTTINFRNCRRAVMLGYWVSTTTLNASFFKYANFLGNGPINEYNGAGIKDFISLWDNNGIKLWGCSFRNTYIGNYRDNSRGIAITSFGINAHIIKGSNTTGAVNYCSFPTGLPNLFEGLDIGIWNGGNTLSNSIKIHGNEFKNVANGVFSGSGVNLKLYDNDFTWDNDFIPPPTGNNIYEVIGIHTGSVNGLNIDQNRIIANQHLPMYTAMFLEHVNDMDYPSTIFNNTTISHPFFGTFGTAMTNLSSNDALDFTCNIYENMMQDWQLGANFRAQVGNFGVPGNANKWTKPSVGTNNISKAGGGNLEYFCANPLNYNDINTPNYGTGIVKKYNHLVQERDCYNSTPCSKYDFDLESGGEHTGAMVAPSQHEFDEALDAMNLGNYELAWAKTDAISPRPENSDKVMLLVILIPIFEQHRPFNMTAYEINDLTILSIGTQPEHEYARNVLTYFAGKTFVTTIAPMQGDMAPSESNMPAGSGSPSGYGAYPNPSTGTMAIGMPAGMANNASLVITDMMGIKVYEDAAYTNNKSIDISQFATGMYMATLSRQGQVVYTTLIAKL